MNARPRDAAIVVVLAWVQLGRLVAADAGSSSDPIMQQIVSLKAAAARDAGDSRAILESKQLEKLESHLAKEEWKLAQSSILISGSMIPLSRQSAYLALAKAVSERIRSEQKRLLDALQSLERDAAELLLKTNTSAVDWQALLERTKTLQTRGKSMDTRLADRIFDLSQFVTAWALLFSPKSLAGSSRRPRPAEILNSPYAAELVPRSTLMCRYEQLAGKEIRRTQLQQLQKTWFAPVTRVSSLEELPNAVAEGLRLRQADLLEESDAMHTFAPLENLLATLAAPAKFTHSTYDHLIFSALPADLFADLAGRILPQVQDLHCRTVLEGLTNETRQQNESVGSYLRRIDLAARRNGNWKLAERVATVERTMSLREPNDISWYDFDPRVAVRMFLRAESLLAEGKWPEARRAYFASLASPAGNAPAKLIGERFRQMEKLDPKLSIDEEWFRGLRAAVR